MQIIAKAIRGTVSLNHDKLREFLLKNEGKNILISFDEFGEGKTKEQLGYFYGAIVGTLVELGWSKRDAVNYLKANCANVEKWYNSDIKAIELVLVSIAEMDKSTLSQFIDECIRFLGDKGIEVPTPEQFWADKYTK